MSFLRIAPALVRGGAQVGQSPTRNTGGAGSARDEAEDLVAQVLPAEVCAALAKLIGRA